MAVTKVDRMRLLLVNFLLLLPSASAYTYSVFEELYTPAKWSRNHRLEPGAVFPVKIALAQRNLDKAEDFIMDVSDPDSANYGKFWTVDQVYETFAPSEETISAVRTWLIAEGIAPERITQSEDKGLLHFDSYAKEAEKLFHAKYYHFSHDHGQEDMASDTISVPDSLKDYIDYVEPGAALTAPIKNGGPEPYRKKPPLKDRHCRDANLTCCDFLVHPGCIRALYQLPNRPEPHEDAPVPNNALGIYEQVFRDSQKDLNLFFRRYASFIPQGTYPEMKLYRGLKKVSGGVLGETALDLDCAYPIVYPQIIQTLQGKQQPEDLFNKTVRPQNVISTSFFEGYEDGPKSKKRFDRSCNGYMKVALLGSSLIISSGDEGTGCPIDSHKQPFTFQIPAVCPFVTSVGATEIPSGNSVYDPEIAVRQYHLSYTTGAGFSQLFPRPKYQEAAVKEYFANHDPGIPYYNGTKEFPGFKTKNGPKYNRLGRGFPDVSANGKNIITAEFGRYEKSGGTSASAPLFASIMNKIVEERLKAGKGPLGFLNPAIYRNPAMFNDITEGFNTGCGYTEAFHAVKGWDPVTGLGTPNYPKMLEYFMKLK